jgi:hypothetical protein
MGNTLISLRRTATIGNVPNPDMFRSNGELILNIADGYMFYLNALGQVATFGSGVGGGPAFSTIVANGSSVVADSTSDSLTLIAGNNISIVGNTVNDSIVIGVTPSLGTAAFETIGDDGAAGNFVPKLGNYNWWANTQIMYRTVVGGPANIFSILNSSDTANSQAMIDLSPFATPFTRSAQIAALNNGGNQISLVFKLSNGDVPTEVWRILHNGAWSFGPTGSNYGGSGFLKSRDNAGHPTWNVLTKADITDLVLPNTFSTIVANGNTLTANSQTNTLRIIAGENITIQGNTENHSIVINSTGSGPGTTTNSFSIIAANGQSLIAGNATSTLNFANGSFISLTSNVTSNTLTFNIAGQGTAYTKNIHVGTSPPSTGNAVNDIWIDTN